MLSTYVVCVELDEVEKFAAYKADVEALRLICLESLTWPQRRKKMLALVVKDEPFWQRARFSMQHSRARSVVARMRNAVIASRRRSVEVVDEHLAEPFSPLSPTLAPTSAVDKRSSISSSSTTCSP
jgi:hypothetical protein